MVTSVTNSVAKTQFSLVSLVCNAGGKTPQRYSKLRLRFYHPFSPVLPGLPEIPDQPYRNEFWRRHQLPQYLSKSQPILQGWTVLNLKQKVTFLTRLKYHTFELFKHYLVHMHLVRLTNVLKLSYHCPTLTSGLLNQSRAVYLYSLHCLTYKL